MLAREKVAAEVARFVMRDAAERKLVPGDHVAAEHELIQRLNVARGSVREGLRLLEAMGVVKLQRGSGGGARLLRPIPQQLATSLAMMLQWEKGTMSTLREARLVIEPTMAALAAQRRSAEHVSELRQLIDELHANSTNSSRFHAANRRFHDLVAEAAGNALLTVLLPSLNWMSEAIGGEVPEPLRKQATESKARIVDAIEQGDSWLASVRMQKMILDADEVGSDQAILSKPIVWADVDELLARHVHRRKDARTAAELENSGHGAPAFVAGVNGVAESLPHAAPAPRGPGPQRQRRRAVVDGRARRKG